MKYGYRWLNRVKVKKQENQIIRKIQIPQSTLAQKVMTKIETYTNASTTITTTNDTGVITKKQRLSQIEATLKDFKTRKLLLSEL